MKIKILKSINYFLKLLNNGDKRSVLAKKQISYSFIIKGASIAIGFLLIPLTINFIDPINYGIWLTLTSVIAWFQVLDIGIGNGLRNKFAEAIASNKDQLAQKYISTAYATVIVLFTVLWFFLTLINQFVSWSTILNTSPEMDSQLQELSFIVITYFCITMILNLIFAIVNGDQRPSLSGLIQLIPQVLILLSLYFLVKESYEGAPLLLFAKIFGYTPIIITFLFSFFLFKNKYKVYRPQFKLIDFKVLKPIFNLGIKFFAINICFLVIYQLTNVIISNILSPKDVTIYNVAYKLFFLFNMIFIIVLTPYWSAFTDAFTKKEFQWMKNKVKMLEKLWLGLVLTIIPVLIVSPYLYEIWIGDTVIIPASTSFYMSIYCVVLTLCNVYTFLLNGIGKIKFQLYIYIISCLIFIAIAIPLTKNYGLNGVIIANSIVCLIIFSLSKIQLNSILNKNAVGIFNK